MKIYSQTLDLSKTTPQTFYVPPHSKFKLGVKLAQDIDFTVKLDGAALESDGDIDGFKTFSLESKNPGNTIYVVEAANGQKVKILQTTTTSTVFEVGGSTQEGNFVKSVNSELPIDGNIDVSKLVYQSAEGKSELTGADIANSLKSIDASLANKLERADIVPIAPATDAPDNALAGAKATAEFVNSSIATNTANFMGTFNSESEFPAVATNNDYLFLDTVDEEGNKVFKRYKYVASTSEWKYEYTLNNSSFTAAQWAAIQSGITAEAVADMAKKSDIVPTAPATDAPEEALAGAKATADFVNSSFVKSVNGDLPVNGNIDVSKLVFTTDAGESSSIDGKAISSSLKNFEDQLGLKANTTDIVPIAPATDAPEGALAGAKSTADFVNSSIATNTANFMGTFTSESEFPAEATNNDYLFLDTVDSEGNKIFKRYKYVESSVAWKYEYTLNNSSFTAAQWAAIQSGITAGDVADMAKKSELDANTVVLSGEFEDGITFNYTVYTK